ncbi:MAG: SurA N-terminal domain-containing protein [Alphaproteobacteria bacterium]|nr:SurA N-terminal domain-containing protein [Alphaproteobacteria bacterium]
MLKQLRNQGASIVVKVLMGVLVLSFATWGLADMFNPNSSGQAVATAGDTEVTQPEFINAYRNQQAQLRARGFSEELLANINVSALVVDQLVSRAVYDEEARQLDIIATPEIISRTILETDEFKGVDGKFDRTKYEFTLSSQGLNPAYYENMVAREVASNILIDSVTAGVSVSKAQAEELFKFQRETRDISYTVVPVDDAAEVATPTDTDLKAFYEENKESFRAPDFRKISYIYVDPDKIAEGIEIEPTQILESYEQRLDQFSTPEQRQIQQMLFNDEASALAAIEAIESGKDFVSVANELAGQTEDDINLGTMTRSEMPDEKLAAAAWSLNKGGVSQPVEGLFGWYVLTVADIIEGSVKPLADVEADLVKELAREKAVSEAYDLSTKLDDAIAGGATLEEAADQNGLELKVISAMDQNGSDADGNFLTDIPDPAKFIQFAFTTEEGLDSLMQDDGADGFYILRVDGVMPSHIKALDDVRDEAIALWDLKQREKAAEQIANEILAKLNNGTSLKEISDIVISSSADVGRPNLAARHEVIPADLMTELFKVSEGEAKVGFAGNAYIVAQIDEINIPSTSESAEIAEITGATLSGITNDLMQQYNMALREKHDVTINQGLISRLIDPDTNANGFFN